MHGLLTSRPDWGLLKSTLLWWLLEYMGFEPLLSSVSIGGDVGGAWLFAGLSPDRECLRLQGQYV